MFLINEYYQLPFDYTWSFDTQTDPVTYTNIFLLFSFKYFWSRTSLGFPWLTPDFFVCSGVQV